jgi:hypothetical protein
LLVDAFYGQFLPTVLALVLIYFWVVFWRDKIKPKIENIAHWLSFKNKNLFISIIVNITIFILYFIVPIGGMILIIYSIARMVGVS